MKDVVFKILHGFIIEFTAAVFLQVMFSDLESPSLHEIPLNLIVIVFIGNGVFFYAGFLFCLCIYII